MLYKGFITQVLPVLVIIETSHLSFHSFSHTGQLMFDLFSCQPYDSNKIEEELVSIFLPQKVTRNFIESE
ncbi:hypothetical protein COX95_04960 [bacterium CG_4_10_14_0_2_um_filter_33_32]|nr:MAG: hypothetical protein COY76_02165 [bacterium CG_4_10_14_0_8_um_filter_33_57]PIZ85180.1 MAG: hypothetical protein COX95_04960 [bacterium CG_4_10_14_0_2_um_filter_33_32]